MLLELLSDFQISIPELGRIEARTHPVVLLTSNNTRELTEALKRRCLYLWLDYPSTEHELEIVRLHAPELPQKVAERLVEIIQMVRELDLKKPPSIAESIDWARALLLLGAEDITPEVFRSTLSIIVKHRTDLDTVAERVGVRLGRRLDVTEGFPAGVVAFAENLRAEGLAVGTSELLDAFAALGEVQLDGGARVPRGARRDAREVARGPARVRPRVRALLLPRRRGGGDAPGRARAGRAGRGGRGRGRHHRRRADRLRQPARAAAAGDPRRRRVGDARPRAARDRRLRAPRRGLGRARRRRPAHPPRARPALRARRPAAARPRRAARARAHARPDPALRAAAAARARARADRAHAGAAAVAAAERARPRAALGAAAGPRRRAPRGRAAQAPARDPGPRDARAQAPRARRRAPHDARLAADRRRAGRAQVPPAPAQAPRALRALRRLDLGHERVGVLPERAARAARRVPQDALVRVRRADLRGHRGLRARALLPARSPTRSPRTPASPTSRATPTTGACGASSSPRSPTTCTRARR